MNNRSTAILPRSIELPNGLQTSPTILACMPAFENFFRGDTVQGLSLFFEDYLPCPALISFQKWCQAQVDLYGQSPGYWAAIAVAGTADARKVSTEDFLGGIENEETRKEYVSILIRES